MGITNGNFIDACYGRNRSRIPVWIMRQAGRYLPEYRAVREKVSFNELCRSPKLIAEVVKQPIERFDLDAAILFSDILTMLQPMGADVDFPNGGPVIARPISTPEDVSRLHDIDVEKQLSFVLDAIREIKCVLPGKPLIGFTGSPFTLACYLVEGKGSKTFDRARRFLQQYPYAAEEMFGLLSRVIAKYLRAQVEAGADAVQIFDSWGGILSRSDYRRWSAEPVSRILADLKPLAVPRILFANNVAPYLDIVNEMDCEVVGVDYRVDLGTAANALKGKTVQGNLDPSVLFSEPEVVVRKTSEILDSVTDHNRLIFNLGHGIQPGTPVESVHALVETVHGYRS